MNIEVATLSVMDGQEIESPAEMGQAALRQGRLYVMVEVSAPRADWDEISRDLVDRVISCVMVSRNLAATALQEAVADLNEYLCEQNKQLARDKKVWASLNAVLIQDNTLVLAQAGPALTYFVRRGSIQRYPAYLQQTIPLGAQPDLPCEIIDLMLEPNDIICLSAYHLPTLATDATIYQAMLGKSAHNLVHNLAILTDKQEFSAYVLQYEPKAAGFSDVPNRNDTTLISSQTKADSTDPASLVNPRSQSSSQFLQAAKSRVVTSYSQFSWPSWLSRLQIGLRHAYSWLLICLLLLLGLLNHLFAWWRTHTAAQPTKKTTFPAGDGSNLVRLITIIGTIFLLVIPVGWWLMQPDVPEESVASPASAFESEPQNVVATLMADAREKIAQAEGADEGLARDDLSRANESLNQALALASNPEQTAQVRALQNEMHLKLDRLDNVIRPPVIMLARLINRRPTTLLYGSRALFVLEKNVIYRLEADNPSANPLQSPFSVPQASLDSPKALTWVPAGGARPHDGLLLITTEGQMFSVELNSGQRELLALPTLTTNIDASAGYKGNLYLLDRTQQQIWKYLPNQRGEYPAAPVPWLTTAGQEKIAHPIDMAIDGYIFLLDQSGQVNRFANGQMTSFSLDRVTPPLTQPVAIAKVPPETSHLFVADHERIIQFDDQGRLMAQYRPPLESNWGQIHDLAVNEEGNALYVLGSNGVYLIQITP